MKAFDETYGTFTSDQNELLRICEWNGCGWAKFALSVRSSGRCTEAQEETLRNMVSRIEAYWKARRERRHYMPRSLSLFSYPGDHDETLGAEFGDGVYGFDGFDNY